METTRESICLLSEAEIDDLRSDAYEVNVTQGVVNYTKHFDRREVVLHPLPGKEVGPKGSGPTHENKVRDIS